MGLHSRPSEINPGWSWKTDGELCEFEYLWDEQNRFMGFRGVGDKAVQHYGGLAVDIAATGESNILDLVGVALGEMLDAAKEKGVDTSDPKLRVQISLIREEG